MLGPNDIVSALEAAGFTHLVWIPDSYLGTWEPALRSSRLAPIRVCREGEAVGAGVGVAPHTLRPGGSGSGGNGRCAEVARGSPDRIRAPLGGVKQKEAPSPAAKRRDLSPEAGAR